MENVKFTEKESLELITSMIQTTKRNLKVGDGNQFLLWGYLTVLTTLSVYLSLMLTQSAYSYNLFFIIPVIGFPVAYYYKSKDGGNNVTTYSDRIIEAIWKVMGTVSTVLILLMSMIVFKDCSIVPAFVLIVISLGSCVTGVVLKEKIFNTSYLGFLAGIYMFYYVPSKGMDDMMLLLFALSFIFVMIIPGHVINHKAKELC